MDSKLKHSPDVWARMHLTPVGQTAKELLVAHINRDGKLSDEHIIAAMEWAIKLHEADQIQLEARAQAFAQEIEKNDL